MGEIHRRPNGAAVLSPLVRTSTGHTARLQEGFDTDPVASGAIAAALGYGYSNAPVWDSAKKRLVVDETSNRPRIWCYAAQARSTSIIDYQAAVTLISDFQSLQHYGLWLQCGDQNVGNGIRLGHINTKLSLSRFVAGTVYAMTLISGSRAVGF